MVKMTMKMPPALTRTDAPLPVAVNIYFDLLYVHSAWRPGSMSFLLTKALDTILSDA